MPDPHINDLSSLNVDVRLATQIEARAEVIGSQIVQPRSWYHVEILQAVVAKPPPIGYDPPGYRRIGHQSLYGPVVSVPFCLGKRSEGMKGLPAESIGVRRDRRIPYAGRMRLRGQRATREASRDHEQRQHQADKADLCRLLGAGRVERLLGHILPDQLLELLEQHAAQILPVPQPNRDRSLFDLALAHHQHVRHFL